ncbi:conserved hypothetical protein [Clavispora lusitaniae ATCC 42720]|uniref:Uncharacterized protein n=1 Tax=Clavispora lusitaniae (strain ATCC 42720) TaxID=306902 RepID=C4Y0X9_CLAL4|nr:uncharacterized protein CLUG_01861 [Clavispora lusitaniae ATCC 42720]EEQ37737.1 conserved hypothetical protein [Clavispora lusitaniae ATCC 42720]
MDQLNGHFVLRAKVSENLLDVLENQLVQLGRLNVWHGTDGKLTHNLGWDDSFCTSTRKGALDTVDRQGWVSPAVLQNVLFVVVQASFGTTGSVQLIHRKVNVVIQSIFLFCQRSDHVGNAWHQNLTVSINQSGQNTHQIGHGLCHNTTENTRVQVGTWTFHSHSVVVAATQTVGQHGFGCSKPVVVGNTNSVDSLEILLGFLRNKAIQTERTRFLHSFETAHQVDWKFPAQGVVGLNDVEPAQNWTFVVGGTTTVQNFSGSVVVHGEWLSVPTVLLKSWLHVVMAVNQNGLLGRVRSKAGQNNRRQSERWVGNWRWSCAQVLQSDVCETQGCKFVDQKSRHVHDFWSKGLVRRNGRDGNGFGQTVDELRLQLIDLGKQWLQGEFIERHGEKWGKKGVSSSRLECTRDGRLEDAGECRTPICRV